MNKINILSLILVMLVLTACGSTNVTVESDFPEPLTRQLPLDVGLIYEQAFREYVHTDDSGFGVNLSIGGSQTALFNQVMAGMFNSAQELSSMEDERISRVDLVIVPHVEEIQLALPHDTQLEIFEIWIKYNIQVFDKQGEPVADWIMTSYGKTMDKFLSSKESAINQAAVAALRDTGAQLVTKFHRAPGVRDWLVEYLHQTRGTP